jgi:hypothetical protein
MQYKFKFDEDRKKYFKEIQRKFPDIKPGVSSDEMKVSNRMEKNYHLSNKKALYWNLKHYC